MTDVHYQPFSQHLLNVGVKAAPVTVVGIIGLDVVFALVDDPVVVRIRPEFKGVGIHVVEQEGLVVVGCRIQVLVDVRPAVLVGIEPWEDAVGIGDEPPPRGRVLRLAKEEGIWILVLVVVVIDRIEFQRVGQIRVAPTQQVRQIGLVEVLGSGKRAGHVLVIRPEVVVLHIESRGVVGVDLEQFAADFGGRPELLATGNEPGMALVAKVIHLGADEGRIRSE